MSGSQSYGPTLRAFEEEMRSKGRLFVYRLSAESPDKNPIEKLWKNTKRDATHCRYFPTFDDLRAAVVGAFEKYLLQIVRFFSVRLGAHQGRRPRV